jgi:hypothetical protein
MACNACNAYDRLGGMANSKTSDPAAILAGLGASWSPDFDAYAAGGLDPARVRCALCGKAPCDCPEFGTLEYFALIDARHGRKEKKDHA